MILPDELLDKLSPDVRFMQTRFEPAVRFLADEARALNIEMHIEARYNPGIPEEQRISSTTWTLRENSV